jgi:hypothetical protein
MQRIKVAPEYSDKYLEIDRPQPLSDKYIEQLCVDVLDGKLAKDITDNVYTEFKTLVQDYIVQSKLNHIVGLEHFNRVDIINGCTQFIDNLYMCGPLQVLTGDYRYHQRLNLAFFKDVGSLIPDIPLLIALPFPRVGEPHSEMNEILSECTRKNIPVHIDGAWITSCRDLDFDFNHPMIKSVGISLSKGLGLGWNRIGIRYTRQFVQDSVTIMNDYRMNNRALSMIGIYFLNNLEPDYLWNKYGETYYKICKDFDLVPTKTIHIALRDNNPVGLTPLIRHVTNQ